MGRKKGNGWATPLGAIGILTHLAYSERKQNKREQRQAQVPPPPTPPKEQVTKADPEELRKLYHSLALKYHPDFAQGETNKRFRNELFKKIKGAYEHGEIKTLRMYQF